MSIEQLLVLIVFLVIPLIQSLFGRRSKRRSGEAEPEEQADLEELVFGRKKPPAVRYEPPPPSAPPTLPKPEPTLVRVAPRVVPEIESAPTPSPAAPARPLSALGAKQRAQSRHLSRLLPRDVEGLRRAILLAEVLGPPRSLDRSDPFRG
jgi:hypothetical protein